ncbi:MAG TPA: ABC transporter permease, partial [Longimicrobiales bacterium]|nr:ABC transporter permease [Longimicrobiales bacterium]
AVGPVYEGREGPGPTAPADFFDWQERARSLELLAASRLERLTLLADGEPLALSGAGVSAEYFELLRVEPFLGRAFGRDEDRPGATPVAVLGHGLWERRFGGDPSVLGRTLAMDERRFTVVGVMPPDFHPPEAIYHGDVVVWYPLAHVREDLGQRSAAFLQVVGRLDDDSTPATAASELQRIISAAREAEGADPITAGVAPLREVTVGDVGPTLVVLLGAVGFLLVLTCANVANLVLVRATERDREMALRTALGAERSRLVRQLVTEGVLLAVGGGVLAVAIAHGSLEVFKATHPGDLPRLAEMVIDLRVLAFALALSVATGVVFGLVPLARTRIDRLSGSLRAGAPSISRGRRTHRLGSALVVLQTAIATILLAGAGLLTNSFLRLHRVDPGFEPDNAVWLHVSVPSDVYATPEQRLAFFGEVESRLESVPGVASVGGTENLPMGRNRSLAWVSPEELTLPTGEDPPMVSLNRITPDYFDAIGTSLLGGRSFALTDDLDSPPVVVVNRALAQRFWPGREALGRRVRLGPPDGDEPFREVVGVVENLRQQSVATAPEPELYIPWRQAPRTNLSFVVRGPAADADLLPALLEEVWAVDATIPIPRRGTLEGQMRASVVEPRFYTLLLSAFAGLALVLALVGLYGTMAYTVERRTHELGVKMALGAGRRRILREVLRKGALLLAAGLTVGLLGAAVTTRFLESFVFGVTPGDPV